MRGQTQYGKGSARRPTKDTKKFDDNWDAIFKKDKDKPKKQKEEKK